MDIIYEDVNFGEDYGIGRSFRRVPYVRALNKKVPDPLISAINQWQNIEQSKGTRPRFIILERYADVLITM